MRKRWPVLATACLPAALIGASGCFPSLGDLSGRDAGDAAAPDVTVVADTAASADTLGPSDSTPDTVLAADSPAAPPDSSTPDAVADSAEPDSSPAACPAGTAIASACQPTALAVAGGNVFWTQTNGTWRIGGDGTNLTKVDVPSVPIPPATGLASDGTTVYWVSQDEYYAVSADGSPPAVPACDAGVGSLATQEGRPVSEGVVVGNTSTALATLSPSDVYYVTSDGEYLYSLARGVTANAACPGGAQLVHVNTASLLPTTSSIVYLNGQVYWGTATSIVGYLGNTENTTIPGESSPQGIATDGAALYWTTTGASAGQGEIRTVTPPSTTVSPLATGRLQPSAIAVDTSYVYWSEIAPTGSGQIMRLSKTANSGATPVLLGCVTPPPIALAVDSVRLYYAASPGSAPDAGACVSTGTIGSFTLP